MREDLRSAVVTLRQRLELRHEVMPEVVLRVLGFNKYLQSCLVECQRTSS